MSCTMEGCTNRSSFCIPNRIRATRCFEHKTSTMDDVGQEQCDTLECLERPSYGVYNTASRCAIHRTAVMTLLQTVHRDRCCVIRCDRKPWFGVIGDIYASRCVVHKTNKMVQISGDTENLCGE
jgi:hypothetical protein